MREAVQNGMTIAEFPTTQEAADASHEAGLAILVGAPNLVLGGSHSGNISAADLIERGLLDVLSSDYVPASLLQAAFLLHEGLDFTLPEAMAPVSRLPAEILGLADRGRIAPGLRADLVRVREVGTTPAVIAVWREGQRIA